MGKNIEKTEEMEMFIHVIVYITGLVKLLRSGHTSFHPVQCPLLTFPAPWIWCPAVQKGYYSVYWPTPTDHVKMEKWISFFSNCVALLSWSTVYFCTISLCNVCLRNRCTKHVGFWIQLSASNLCVKCFLWTRVSWLFQQADLIHYSVHCPALMFSTPHIFC